MLPFWPSPQQSSCPLSMRMQLSTPTSTRLQKEMRRTQELATCCQSQTRNLACQALSDKMIAGQAHPEQGCCTEKVGLQSRPRPITQCSLNKCTARLLSVCRMTSLEATNAFRPHTHWASVILKLRCSRCCHLRQPAVNMHSGIEYSRGGRDGFVSEVKKSRQPCIWT